MIQFTLTKEGLKTGMRISDIVGLIPTFASEFVDKPLREQFNQNYSFGGGWNPFDGFTMKEDGTITYPGDPALKPLAVAKFRNQTIYVYLYGWVAIVEEDGKFEISRMD